MNIIITNNQEGQRYLESGSHYNAVRFNPLRSSSFHMDWNLCVDGYAIQERKINTLMSLNQLRELRDALNKILPEK